MMDPKETALQDWGASGHRAYGDRGGPCVSELFWPQCALCCDWPGACDSWSRFAPVACEEN
jgi:hypothetical protein